MKKVMFTAFALWLCLNANVMAQVPSYVPTNGLVGWWPFNGNANDESGNGNNGTVNGATLTADRFGNVGKAYSFDGVNDFISTTPTLPTGSAPRTVSCWFKTIAGSIPTSQYPELQVITGWGNPFSGAVVFPQFVQAPSGKAYFESGSSGNQLFSQNAVNDDIWHQIVTTYDGSNSRVKLYIDATLQDSSALVSLGTVSSFFGIGNVSWANVPFQGQIDDVAIWNRALTEQEIANLYNGCSNTSITSQPANTSANPNTTAQFSIAATNVTSYQWQTDLGVGFQNVSNAGQFSGATNDTLTVSNVSTTNNNQQFRCIINSNGCVDTSTVAVLSVSTNGINELISQKNFAIFPNPAKSNFEIKTDLSYDKIEILDIQGRLVQIEPKNKVISISSLQKGTYIIRLIDDQSNVIGIQQLVKE
jgi:hypothetical protein